MSLLDDLFLFLRPRVKPDETPPPLPSLDELHVLLDRTIVERGEAEHLIRSAPDQRDALLEQPGTDAEIKRLDKSVETAHRLLERLDRIEPDLRTRILAASADTRLEAWHGMRCRLAESLVKIAHTRSAFELAYGELNGLRLEAQKAGFPHETNSFLPWWKLAEQLGWQAWFDLASAQLRQPACSTEPAVKLWNIQFLEWTRVIPSIYAEQTTAYQAGQNAGFAADVAWRLVDSGKAIWPDPKLIAPKPPKPKKLRKPRQVDNGSRAMPPPFTPDTMYHQSAEPGDPPLTAHEEAMQWKRIAP